MRLNSVTCRICSSWRISAASVPSLLWSCGQYFARVVIASYPPKRSRNVSISTKDAAHSGPPGRVLLDRTIASGLALIIRAESVSAFHCTANAACVAASRSLQHSGSSALSTFSHEEVRCSVPFKRHCVRVLESHSRFCDCHTWLLHNRFECHIGNVRTYSSRRKNRTFHVQCVFWFGSVPVGTIPATNDAPAEVARSARARVHSACSLAQSEGPHGRLLAFWVSSAWLHRLFLRLQVALDVVQAASSGLCHVYASSTWISLSRRRNTRFTSPPQWCRTMTPRCCLPTLA